MKTFTIYHNPKCSKSRATLALLQEHGVEPRVVEYLKTPPTAAELKGIVAKLGIQAEQLVHAARIANARPERRSLCAPERNA